MLVFSLLLEPVSLAALSDDKGGYESQAAAKLQQSNELQSKIDNVSEEKRALDEAADAAIKEHEARKAELDATDARLKQNEEERSPPCRRTMKPSRSGSAGACAISTSTGRSRISMSCSARTISRTSSRAWTS